MVAFSILMGLLLQAPVDSTADRLQAFDVIRVYFVGAGCDFSGGTPIRADGLITVQLIGDVQAAGETPQNLKTAIEARLSEFIRNPEVTIKVLTRSPSPEK